MDESDEEAAALKFDGSSGRSPDAEAKRYVYGILHAMLDHEHTDMEGWIFGGYAHPRDKKRLHKMIDVVKKELGRKAWRK